MQVLWYDLRMKIYPEKTWMSEIYTVYFCIQGLSFPMSDMINRC